MIFSIVQAFLYLKTGDVVIALTESYSQTPPAALQNRNTHVPKMPPQRAAAETKSEK